MSAATANRVTPRPPGARDLASFAASAEPSRGRLYPEAECMTRSPFQRDRDRVIHSTAFRRLTHKTQVFVYHEGDHYRSRLTHTIEVAQIARTIARQLSLDEDLAEALALAHDLGHPPFGHAGERALDLAAKSFGGFDHNAQSLRVVSELERKYADFDGLNLTWETLEGLVKHNGPLIGANKPDARDACPPDILSFNERFDLKLAQHASAEAQVAAISDDIAYNNHDIDDALRAGLITVDMLADVELPGRHLADLSRSHQDLSGQRLVYEVNRRLITEMVADAVAESRHRLASLAPRTADDIRRARFPVVAFSGRLSGRLDDLRDFLFQNVYRHPRVMTRMREAEAMVAALFNRYMEHPEDLPDRWREEASGLDTQRRARLIVDFVAGMTDRYAAGEYARLFDAQVDLG